MGKRPNWLKVDKELVIVFLLVAITGLIFYFVNNQRAFLNFFYLPVLVGAYLFGKRHGTYSSVLSFLLIFAVAWFYPETFAYREAENESLYRWLDIMTWGGFLVVTGYAMGLLYEKKEKTITELNATYRGIITMLSVIIDSVDKQTQNHSYRVSRYAEKLAMTAGLPPHEIEDIRTASLLHDLGKISVSADILRKIGSLSEHERAEVEKHAGSGASLISPLGQAVTRIVPLILYHHERYDGKGYYGLKGKEIPFGSQLISVADVFDAMTTDRPYRKALSPMEVKNEIMKDSGTQFDPDVIRCFEEAFPTLLSLSTHQFTLTDIYQ